MAAVSTVASIVWSLFFTPFLLFILCIIFLASIGKSLGVRRLYVNILLKLFEYGRQHIEVAKKLKRVESNEDEGGGWEEENQADRSIMCADVSTSALMMDPAMGSETSAREIRSDLSGRRFGFQYISPDDGPCNGIRNVGQRGGVVIQRENLLAPDRALERLTRPGPFSNCNGSVAKPLVPVEPSIVPEGGSPVEGGEQTVSPLDESNPVTPSNLDFDLSSCLYYVKAGVESIIEDQVTSVFEAEELRSWNLLTRTNRRYEFVSWRLSVIWMMGFFVRYCFLLPLRILICFIGVFWMIIAFGLCGQLPEGRIKRAVSDISYRIAFRILSRSLSCVLTFHLEEYKPKRGGYCVANHTSPIDVVMLSSETCFSLVLLLTTCTAAVGCLPEGPRRRRLNRRLSASCFSLLSRSLSAVITYKGSPPRRGICVANHTSPIDVLVLMCDNCYSLIGQRHGGFLGLLQRALARASPHIWFERSEVKDRNAVTNRLREHVSDPNNPPILIFPEGTCINNTSVMQFKKGSFEVGGVIYPVAIKYDPKFGDAFWNSSRYSMMQYLYMMMTSWAIVCDVWYLPPMQRRPNESAIEFANRVKAVIARQGGLVDLVWDGQLKRMKAKKEWKELQQEEFSRRLKGE